MTTKIHNADGVAAAVLTVFDAMVETGDVLDPQCAADALERLLAKYWPHIGQDSTDALLFAAAVAALRLCTESLGPIEAASAGDIAKASSSGQPACVHTLFAGLMTVEGGLA